MRYDTVRPLINSRFNEQHCKVNDKIKRKKSYGKISLSTWLRPWFKMRKHKVKSNLFHFRKYKISTENEFLRK